MGPGRDEVLAEGPHLESLRVALEVEGRGHAALLAGRPAQDEMRAAAAHYRESWELAPPGSYGRLIGMLKAAVIAGDAGSGAAYARAQIPSEAESPPASYALAIAALVEEDDPAARVAAARMRGASEPFGNAAVAIEALAAGDQEGYSVALRAIVADFEGRDGHLTGVPIADTALMLERLAEPRGLACRPSSPLLPG